MTMALLRKEFTKTVLLLQVQMKRKLHWTKKLEYLRKLYNVQCTVKKIFF